MSMANKQGIGKIEWCDETINPVVGCKRGCPYCFAKRMNDRFGFVKDFRSPEIRPGALSPVRSRKPRSVFFDSMSDFGFWTPDQTEKVFSWFGLSSQKSVFIGLTKSPDYIEAWNTAALLFNEADLLSSGEGFGQRLFLGYTIDGMAQVGKALAAGKGRMADFLSVEPLEEDVSSRPEFWDFVRSCRRLKVVIIGAETGNRLGKVVCRKAWADGIVKGLDKAGVPVFMKSSLRETMGSDFRQDRLPWPTKWQSESGKGGK